MLNGMCRNAIGEEIEIVGEEGEDDENLDGNMEFAENKKKRRMQKIVMTKAGGEKTLEKETNLNVTTFDTQHEVDPLFKKTT